MKSFVHFFFLCLTVTLAHAGPETGNEAETTKKPADISSILSQPDKVKINLLELVSGVGKAIHLMINQNQNSSLNQRASLGLDMPLVNSTLTALSSSPKGSVASDSVRAAREKEENNKRAEELRVEIARRTAQLQKIVGSAIEVMRDRGDVMVRRILEHLNTRLEQARTSADKILKEPATSEMAVRALNTINQGLNSVNQMIHNTLNRVNIRINVDLKKPNGEPEKVKEN